MTNFYDVWIDFNVRVTLRDGIELSADVYRPSTTKDGARFPAILIRTPYNKNGELALKQGRWFAQHGYVVVWMDVRGRGDSDGIFSPYFNEGQDGYDAVEWCAAQPWCDGKVGSLGGSYLGHIQWLTALQKPPHLAAMVVLVTPSDPFVETPTGSPSPMHLCWLHLVSGRLSQNMQAVDWEQVYKHLPLLTMDERAGRTNAMWREKLLHTQLDSYWEPLRYQNQFHKIDLPVLHISGWYDDEQIGTPLNFRGMTDNATSEFARENQKLVMGPWGHQVNTNQKIGEVDFEPQALIDLRSIQVEWFDRFLKNQPPDPQHIAPVRIFVMGANQWRDEQAWPLERTRWTRFYLHSQGHANSRFGNGMLSDQPQQPQPPDRYTYDPARPTPFITEPTSSQIGGPDDYAAIEQRDDVLVYVTPPLEEVVEITGPVSVELYAASSAPDTDFMAKLVDIHPNGFTQRLCDGMVRARFRAGMHAPSPIVPGEIYHFEINLWNTSQVFLKGHQIGLEISSSAFPKYDRNLNTGEDLATGTRMEVARQTIYHDPVYPSAIILPRIPAST